MKKHLFILFFVLLFTQVNAQESFMPWGAIDSKDLAMTVYPADSNASAVILGSFCYTYFNYFEGRFQVSYKIHKRIKILKKEGYTWANVQIPLYSASNGESRENVSSIKGITYRLDSDVGGIKRTFLDEKSIYRETLRQHKGRSVELVKFALPDIKEGAIIEYTYSIDSDFITVLNAWEFQSQIPVRKSEYQIKMSDELSYVYVLQSQEAFAVSPDNKKKIAEANAGANTYRWVQENIAAFKDESFIATSDDYIGKIQFQLASYQFPNSVRKEIFSTWEKTILELLADSQYGGFINRKGATQELVSKLIVGQNSEKDKMKAIYDYVKSNFKAENRTGISAENSPKDIVEKKKGSKQEINLLLINMLKEADLDASPILLSTRTHGRVYKNYPILERFNYSIAYIKIGNEEFLLDATDPMLSIGMLPANVLNGEGLLMRKNKGESQWINLQNRSKSSETWITRLNIREDGTLEGRVDISLQGYKALAVRQKYAKLESETEQEEASENIGSSYELFKDSLQNLYEYEKPLKSTTYFKSNLFSEQSGDRIYLNPLLDLKMKENPLKAKERKTLIDFAYPYEESFLMTFLIPENYQVEESPKSERIQWEDKSVRFDYLVSINGSVLQVVCKTIINRAVFSPEEYTNLRDTFAKIVAKQNEQIVLKKK